MDFFFLPYFLISRALLVAQMVKHLPAVWETRVRSLAREYPLEKETATHSSTLAWKIPWTKEPGRLQSSPWGRKESDTTEWLPFFLISPPYPFPLRLPPELQMLLTVLCGVMYFSTIPSTKLSLSN